MVSAAHQSHDTDPAKLWAFYLQLVAVEEAFKNFKGVLAIRIAFFAYCLRVTLHVLAPGLTTRNVIEKVPVLKPGRDSASRRALDWGERREARQRPLSSTVAASSRNSLGFAALMPTHQEHSAQRAWPVSPAGQANVERPDARPSIKFEDLRTEYSNLFYACRACNGRKGKKWFEPEPGGVYIVNPCQDSMAEHLWFEAKRAKPRSKAGALTEETLRPNDSASVKFRAH